MIVEANNFQFVHLKVKFSYLHNWLFFNGIYGSPWWALRKELWNALGYIAQNANWSLDVSR